MTRQLIDPSVSCPFAMSNARDAACALNSLFQEGHDLFGSSDGPALSDFVQEFFSGDDPIDSDGEWNTCNHCHTLPNYLLQKRKCKSNSLISMVQLNFNKTQLQFINKLQHSTIMS